MVLKALGYAIAFIAIGVVALIGLGFLFLVAAFLGAIIVGIFSAL